MCVFIFVQGGLHTARWDGGVMISERAVMYTNRALTLYDQQLEGQGLNMEQ